LGDDDIDDRELFGDALADVNNDISLDTAEDGIEALKKLQDDGAETPDLIFLDLNMPRMDGKQFLKKIKENNALSEIPVYIYSTSSNEEDRKETIAMGAAKFIVKPNSYTALCDIIRSATGHTA
jgi:CheY-like chemotaxis protein